MTRQEFVKKWGMMTSPEYGRALFDCSDKLLADLEQMLEEERSIVITSWDQISHKQVLETIGGQEEDHMASVTAFKFMQWCKEYASPEGFTLNGLWEIYRTAHPDEWIKEQYGAGQTS